MTNTTLDKISGVAFILLGVLVVLGAWQMPRFEAQGAPIYQSPGLTPGLLGLGLAICGVVLALRPARADGAERSYWDTVAGTPTNRKRAGAALFLTLVYGAVLFGNVPYVVATFLFVFAFVVTFEMLLVAQDSPSKGWKPLVAATLLGLAVSLGSQYVFQTLFLVQLP